MAFATEQLEYMQMIMAFATKQPESENGIELRGFGFVRFFILAILALGILLVAGVVILGRHVEMEISVEASGQVEPVEKKFVKAETSGTIEKVLIRTGQEVAKGDTLFVLGASEWEKEAAKIEKEIAINQRQREELEEKLFFDRQKIESNLDQARLEHEASDLRLEQIVKEYQLYEKYLKARNEQAPHLDTLLPVKLQKNTLNRVQQRMTYLNIERDALTVRAREIQTLKLVAERLRQECDWIREQIEKTALISPIAGIVLTADIEAIEGDRVSVGSPVVELAQLNAWQARVFVQEVDISKIERGQEVRLYLHAFPHMNYKIFSGTVIELPSRNQVAPPGAMPVNALTLYPVKIWIDEPFVRSGDQIYPVAYGMRLDAKIIIERNLIWKIAWKKIAEAFGIVDKQHPFVF